LQGANNVVNLSLVLLSGWKRRFGYNIWRDPLQPTAILEKLCIRAGLEPPVYRPGSVTVGNETFYEEETVENEQGLSVVLLVILNRTRRIRERRADLSGND